MAWPWNASQEVFRGHAFLRSPGGMGLDRRKAIKTRVLGFTVYWIRRAMAKLAARQAGTLELKPPLGRIRAYTTKHPGPAACESNSNSTTASCPVER